MNLRKTYRSFLIVYVMKVTDFLRDRLHNKLGIVDPVNPQKIGNLKDSEWSFKFECLQRSRLIMGAIRYGPIGALNKPQWDRVPDMMRRLNEYMETGNLENLVDVANLCLLEFVEGKHPNRHFSPSDDGPHVKLKN